MDRRAALLRLGAALSAIPVGLRLPGCGSRGEAPAFLALEEPCTLPFDALSDAWASVEFRAKLRTPSGRKVIVPGLAVRVRDSGGTAEGLRVYSRICPHELCTLGYVQDPSGLKLDPGAVQPPHPLIVCPCHFSVFDPLEDGKRLGGPAPRGAYQFRFHAAGASLEVTHVDAGVLRLL